MNPEQIVDQYYRAWRERAGDMTGVPLAPGFVFRGPVASFEDADGYRAMARQAGAMVGDFHVRHQFTNGDLVCSIVDWTMGPVPGTLTAAELLRVRDGEIVEGELIYDAEDLRRAMNSPDDLIQLLELGFEATTALLAQVTPQGWARPSPCEGWTVRQVGDHLVGGLTLLGRFARGEAVRPEETDAQLTAGTDHLGTDPAAAFTAAAEGCVAAFAAPGTLETELAFVSGLVPGRVLANICLLEALVHGWDIAYGAGLPYKPENAEVDAVATYAYQAVGAESRANGLFGPALPSEPDDPPFTALLAHLGRRA